MNQHPPKPTRTDTILCSLTWILAAGIGIAFWVWLFVTLYRM